MKGTLRLDHEGYYALRRAVMLEQTRSDDQWATLRALRRLGIRVPPGIREVQILIVDKKPDIARIEPASAGNDTS